MQDVKCDRIVGEGTCNCVNSDPSGLCSAHRGMRGETLRDLRARIRDLEATMREVRLYAYDDRLQAIRVVVAEALSGAPRSRKKAG